MTEDPYTERLFQMKLAEIYQKHSWLSYELSESEFISLFKIEYKNDIALSPGKPEGIELGRDIFLEVLVAFKHSFKYVS